MGVLDDLCRFCGQKLDRTQSQNIFNKENRHLLKTALLCIPLRMTANDCYPKYACIHCVFKLSVIVEFRDNGLSAAKLFDEILSGEASKSPEPEILVIKEEELPEIEFLPENEITFEVAEMAEMSSAEYENRIINEQNPQKCKNCNRNFISTARLERCKKCEKALLNQSGASSSKQKSPAKAQYECQACQRFFSCQSLLVTHMRIHTGEKPFQCKECKKSFAQKGSLVTHMRIHTGERPYQCKDCLRSFARKADFIGHLRAHTQESEYRCEHCPMTFRAKCARRIHRQQNHFKKKKSFPDVVCLGRKSDENGQPNSFHQTK